METVSLPELKTYLLEHVEETELLELLDLTTQELVEAFDDKIVDRFDFLVAKLELEDDSRHDSDDSGDYITDATTR